MASGEFFLEASAVLDGKWKQGKLENVHVSGGSLTCSLFEDCSFSNVTFENMHLDEVDFLRCHFESFTMLNCTHEGMEMRECTGNPPTIIGSKEAC